eukprot:CAMPEP_0194726448 /NCGR_PEP_ID=MMETSP0296-20130528/31380_1 /TAXON_ID=39354 /ORGANISM="Heterosigma akashiwo, Strain CCMP2393" /LENGTH=92 /DNA_ID=CAMNT_0039631447 /DNA_START=29 /DNA_END=307 /DNA_ORIENTATION=+
MASFAEKLIHNILTPGAGANLTPYINFALISLLIVLGITAYSGYASIHLAVMAFLAIGLMLSLNWFISEYKKALARQEEEGKLNDDEGKKAK